MKKSIIISLVGILIILTNGCNRVSHNGKIDGYWMVRTLERDGKTETFENGQYTICINLELMQIHKEDAGSFTGIMTWDKSEKRLGVEFKQPANPSQEALDKCGIYTNPVAFDVSVNNKALVLKTPESVITARRW